MKAHKMGLGQDLRTMFWKEGHSLFRGGGSKIKAALTVSMPLGLFGIYVPWSANEYWLEGNPPFFAAMILPLTVAILVVPDSFAGERERHTLPTLLASRIPDEAILMGKGLFAFALSWGTGIAVLIMGLLVVNLTHWNGEFQLYSPKVAVAGLAGGGLMAALSVAAGILTSLRSGTVQEAQQTLIAMLAVPPTLLGPLILLLGRMNPEWKIPALVDKLGSWPGILAAFTVGSALTVTLLIVVQKRFRRDHLTF